MPPSVVRVAWMVSIRSCAAGDDAADQVRVSGEIFRAGMHDQINAEVRRDAG